MLGRHIVRAMKTVRTAGLAAAGKKEGGASLMTWVNSETGPKTTHFWGPIANWGFVIAGLNDTLTKEPDTISPKMTGVLCMYSALFMRFAWVISPRNYILFACHVSNECVQLNQMRRWATWRYAQDPEEDPVLQIQESGKDK
mmetsp:Transcript_1594/g.3607  ORF Transcript_1594/g.3607 Transcript_1594/m.3607 type:complete len:142 (-) Transcript_1594:72-497(-)